GLFSNLDTDSIITQLMAIERKPVTLLETKQKTLGYQKDALNEVNNSLLSLKSSISSFASGLTFENKLSSSDESQLTGTATSSASQGTYTINVTSLAQKHIVATAEQDATWTAGAGVLSITATPDVPGPTFNINVAGQTLTQIRDLINAEPGFSAYGTAQVITDPINNKQILTITSANTGTANRFTIVDGSGTLGTYSSQAAADAALTVNGVNIQSSSNTITTAISGVTLNLKGKTGANPPAEITIGLDEDAIVSKISDFVDKFNASTDLIDKYMKEEKVSDATTEEDMKKGVLQSDFDLGDSKSQVRMRTTGYVDNTLTTYKTLSQLGIESEASVGSIVSNNITFDESKLRAALQGDKTEVGSLLQGWATQLDTYLESETEVSVSSTLAGNYYRRILSINDQISSIDDEITNWEDKLASEEERLRSQFSAMEEALQKLQTQSTYITNQLSSISSSKSSS
ncbi:MAG TPA: flagellar filament capping protein FliD, partial [bacterium]|nr:flagellar filament capping protein FliD [bacterium]